MKCGKCQFENPIGVKFCGHSGISREVVCPKCSASNSRHFTFCRVCGFCLTSPPRIAPQKDLSFDETLSQIQKDLLNDFAEKILSQRDRIGGEHRHVTIMFINMKGFTPRSREDLRPYGRGLRSLVTMCVNL